MAEGLKTVGGRISTLRAIGKLSQKKLAQLCEMSSSSIENIELGRTILKREQAIQMVNALKKIGIVSSIDWIIDGTPPLPLALDKQNTNVFYDLISTSHKLIINDTNDFLKKGSVVIGSEIDQSKITNEPFIIVKHNKNISACKATTNYGKTLLQKTEHQKTEIINEMAFYFPSIIITKVT